MSKKQHPQKTPRERFITGSFFATQKGYGFVRPDSGGLPDVFIPAHATLRALTLDYVEIQAHFSERGRASGKVVKILKRRSEKLVGSAFKENGTWFLCEKASRLSFPLELPSRLSLLNDTPVIATRISRRGKEIARYEKSIDPADFKSCEEALLAQYGFDGEFPSEVESEMEKIVARYREKHLDVLGLPEKSRVDLKKKAFVTIDGADAKDFDDAVYAERTKSGYRLFVSIADVAAFVKEGAACDLEAKARGTSTYFPGFAIPMLPEILSNGLCSLVPKEERYTLTAELDLSETAEVLKTKIYPSVIFSNARLTYEEVDDFLKTPSPVLHEKISKEADTSLRTLEAIAKLLITTRKTRGSIDFDLPEANFVLNPSGDVKDIQASKRLFAHRLIEECMIAANEAVARFIEKHKLPGLFRVHEDPDTDALQHFLESAAAYEKSPRRKESLKGKKGRPEPHAPSSKELQDLLLSFKGIPAETFLMKLFLRSLKQANYRAENTGHFGLASESYTHFTSPIRRYPDLYVHRLLRQFFLKKSLHGKSAEAVAAFSSHRERISMEAEREMKKLRSAAFMRDKLGREFDGTVSHVSAYGFFVLLDDYFVEGFVRKEDLGLGAQFDEKKLKWITGKNGQSYELGHRLRIQVEKVDFYERTTVFHLVSKISATRS